MGLVGLQLTSAFERQGGKKELTFCFQAFIFLTELENNGNKVYGTRKEGLVLSERHSGAESSCLGHRGSSCCRGTGSDVHRATWQIRPQEHQGTDSLSPACFKGEELTGACLAQLSQQQDNMWLQFRAALTQQLTQGQQGRAELQITC